MRSQLHIRHSKLASTVPNLARSAITQSVLRRGPQRAFCQAPQNDMASTVDTSQPVSVTAEEARAKAIDMLTFINAAWTPYHAVEEASMRLLSAGYQHIAEKDAWRLKPGRHAVGDGQAAV